jgi:hypothetical protein
MQDDYNDWPYDDEDDCLDDEVLLADGFTLLDDWDDLDDMVGEWDSEENFFDDEDNEGW